MKFPYFILLSSLTLCLSKAWANSSDLSYILQGISSEQVVVAEFSPEQLVAKAQQNQQRETDKENKEEKNPIGLDTVTSSQAAGLDFVDLSEAGIETARPQVMSQPEVAEPMAIEEDLSGLIPVFYFD